MNCVGVNCVSVNIDLSGMKMPFAEAPDICPVPEPQLHFGTIFRTADPMGYEARSGAASSIEPMPMRRFVSRWPDILSTISTSSPTAKPITLLTSSFESPSTACAVNVVTGSAVGEYVAPGASGTAVGGTVGEYVARDASGTAVGGTVGE